MRCSPRKGLDECARGIKTLLAAVNLHSHAILQSASANPNCLFQGLFEAKPSPAFWIRTWGRDSCTAVWGVLQSRPQALCRHCQRRLRIFSFLSRY